MSRIQNTDITNVAQHQLIACLEFANETSARFPVKPTSNSVYFREMHNIDDCHGDLRIPSQTIDDIYSRSLGILLPAVSCILNNLVKVIDEPMQPYGYLILGRAALEIIARTWWLTDQEVNLQMRLSRHFTSYHELLLNQKAMCRTQTEKDHLDVVIANFKKEALYTGLEPVLNRRGKLIGYGGVVFYKSFKLVEDFLSTLGRPVEDDWYRSMSGAVHGSEYKIMESMAIESTIFKDRAKLKPMTDLVEVLYVAELCIESFLEMVSIHARVIGADFDEIAEGRGRILKPLAEIKSSLISHS